MRDTEILLTQHVANLGRRGDIVRVAPGYARNYLIPRGIGIAATEDNKQVIERRRERLDAEEALMFAEIDERLGAMSGLVVKTTERADENGHLYGSVNAMTIVSLLAGVGHRVEEKDVRLEKHIKEVGTYQIPIHLHAERSTEITVEVLAEGADAPTPSAKEPAESPGES